ncbi:MAG: alcohol dehydrogenase catalytic domain-containing protein [Actinobacteria bacterium]|nr:alcohol dehydrogenase catalytic domain-containing protein [Actinomycetota bacterium]
MRALVLEAFGRVAVRERDDPTPGPGELLVEVVATGICGSDIHGFTGENGRRQPGQVMGHETVGRVRALGAGLSAPPVGLTVAVNPVVGCGACPDCAVGRTQQCPDKTVLGVTPSLTSAFAELLVIPAANAVPFEPAAPIEHGALVEPLAVGLHAAARGGVTSDDRVLVVGAGPIGQAALLAARRFGASRIAFSDPDPSRRAQAVTLGGVGVDPTADRLGEQVRAALGGAATVVLEAVGSEASMSAAMACSQPGARIVLLGMAQPQLPVRAYEISTAERSIIGSFCYSPEEFADTAAWVGRHGSLVDGLIDERVGLDEAPDAFARLARGGSSCKVMVFPQSLPANR